MNNIKLEEAGMEPAEALKKFGADYQIKLAPMFAQFTPGDFNGIKAVPTHKLSYAVDSEGVERRFGVVGAEYTPVDNLHCLEAFNALRTEFGYALRYVGHLQRGIVAILRQGEVEVVPGDPVGRDITITTDHGGRGCVRAVVSSVRLASNCILYSGSDKGVVELRARHTSRVKERLVASAAQISALVTGHAEMLEQFKALAAKPFQEAEIEHYLDLLLGPINAKNKAGVTIQTARREEAKRYILEGLGNQMPAVKGTWWAAVNGIVEWIEKTRDSESALIGTGANKKRSALLHAVALSQ